MASTEVRSARATGQRTSGPAVSSKKIRRPLFVVLRAADLFFFRRETWMYSENLGGTRCGAALRITFRIYNLRILRELYMQMKEARQIRPAICA